MSAESAKVDCPDETEEGKDVTSSSSETTPSLISGMQEVNKPALPHENGDIDADVTDCVLKMVENVEKMQLDGPQRTKKSVKFPEETCVMGYSEPHDPWKNADQWTTAELVQAYKKSCDKHGSKPLPKVLQQLNVMEHVGERYEILSLKGERLDQKQCESLEDIFKLVRFRCLDLEATHLDDETAVSIFEMVEFYGTACKLNISFNKNIGPRGWQSCSKLVRKTPCLTFMDARSCDLNERVIPILGRSLRMGCYLTRLQLQSTNLAGKPLFYLVCALKQNETLKELFIGDNKLMPTDGVQLGNLLKFNHKLELLDLRSNHLQDEGLNHICDGIYEQNYGSGLLTIVLWSNQITFKGMSAVSRALMSTESLQTINLGHNNITNEGVHLIKEGLLKTKSLLKLGLSGTKVSCEGAVALAEVIADSPRLERVDLQENDIKTAGLMALSLALKVNESLTRLDIDKETKKESGIKDYAEQQKRMMQEIQAALDNNRTVARQRNLAKKQLELKNEENARKLAEEQKERETYVEEEAVYIPSEDTIHRPKLLFLHEECPESTLDSPVCSRLDHPISPQTVLSPAASAALSFVLPPKVPTLLSPQYCPKIKAKKLFSVTRVELPEEPVDVLGVPEMLNMSELSARPSSGVTQTIMDISPTGTYDASDHKSIDTTLVQKSLEMATLESYIQQIVDGVDTIHLSSVTSEASGSVSELSNGSQEVVSVIEPGMQSSVAISINESSDKMSGSAKTATEECGQAASSSLTVDQYPRADYTVNTQEGNKGDNPRSGQCDKEQDVFEDCIDLESVSDTIAKGDNSDNICNSPPEDSPLSGTSFSICKLDADKSNQKTCIPISSESNNDSTVIITDKMCNQEITSDGSLESTRNLSGLELPVLGNTEASEADAGNSDHGQIENSGEGGASKSAGDGDQWNTVDKSELSGQPECGSARRENPDFFTSLSLNGLKQELANLIDGDDGSQLAKDCRVIDCSIVDEDLIEIEEEVDDLLSHIDHEMTQLLVRPCGWPDQERGPAAVETNDS